MTETDERRKYREQKHFWVERGRIPCWDAIPLLLCHLFPHHKNCGPQVLSSWLSGLLFLSFIHQKSRFSYVLIHQCLNKPGIRRKGRQGGHLLGLTRLRVCSPLTVLWSSLSDKLCMLCEGDKEIRERNLSKEKLSTPPTHRYSDSKPKYLPLHCGILRRFIKPGDPLLFHYTVCPSLSLNTLSRLYWFRQHIISADSD